MTTKLSHPPLDCISRVRFQHGRGSLLLVSSWDGHVRLYDVATGLLTGLHKHNLAVLDCTWLEDTSKAVSAGLEGQLVTWDFRAQRETVVGVHEEAIRCVEYHNATCQVFAGSWDRTLRAWDPRQPGVPVSVTLLGAKAFCLDVGIDKVIVGGSDRKIHIFDLRRLDRAIEKRESSLKHQIRAVKFGNDQRSYASCSVEGRVAVEYLDPQENEDARYAFKCHRVRDESTGEDIVHPVNALAFHPVHGTFATGGSDGGVCVWDASAKKRLWRLSPFDTAVSSLSFSSDGASMAIGVSYTFDNGDTMQPPATELAIRQITDAEVMPKSKK